MTFEKALSDRFSKNIVEALVKVRDKYRDAIFEEPVSNIEGAILDSALIILDPEFREAWK